jgi:putative inorganic carbon (HCO3(-)) transporter
MTRLSGMKNKLYCPKSKSEILKVSAISIFSLIFLVAGLMVSKEGDFLTWLLPLSLALIILAIYSIDIFLLSIVFLTPLSVQLRFIINDPPADLFLPTEIMLFGVFFIVTYKLFVTKEFKRKLILHPVSIVIFITLVWALITSFTSVYPVVSLKNLLTRFWFISGFYLLASALFQKKGWINRYLLSYILGMVPVIIYFMIMMLNSGLFNQTMSHSVIRPFFNDHTSFGASLAFCIPVLIYFLCKKGETVFFKLFIYLAFILFLAAFIFSYSRAAWLSILGATLFVIIILLKISWKIVFATGVLIFVVLFTSWSSILMKLADNRQVSTSNLALHLQSVSNITSDVSNKERINRWKSAIRMFKEKPVMGWGPGTYQFEYASYQRASEKTGISTNFGDKGNAHSEYLGSLVDSGLPALILYLTLIVVPLVRGIRFIKITKVKTDRYLVIALMSGLVTYVIHGFLNNFLDTDKISALFWGYIAGITAFELSLEENDNNQQDHDRSAAIIETSSNK